jgi:hypothetical protein
MPSLASLVTRHAAEAPERPAVRLDDVVVPYGMLDEASARLAGVPRRAASAPAIASG